jgi:hypothetical protein
MTNIARRTANGAAVPVNLPSTLRLPEIPASVASHMRAVEAHAAERAAFYAAAPEDREHMFVGPVPQLHPLSDRERDAVEQTIHAMRDDLEPVSQDAFKAWLGPVNAAVRNPQSAEDFAVRCLGLHALCCDLPTGAFTADARRDLPEFFPSAADIRKAVARNAKRLADVERALRAAAEARQPQPEPEAERQPLTEAQKAEVRAKAEAFARDMAAMVTKEAPPVTARPLAPHHLLAAYEELAARGNEAAKMRAEQLRQAVAQ